VPVVVEVECTASVTMGSGKELSLLKLGEETITTNIEPARGGLRRGKFYRVTFEEISDPHATHQ